MITRDVAGAVLTGGASRRMGTDKALLVVGGVALATRVGATLEAAGCAPVWCQGGDRPALESLGLVVAADDEPGEGPLAAVCSALRLADGEVVVAACDLPDLTAAVVTAVMEPSLADHDVAVAVADGRRQLLARWSPSALETLSALVGRGVRSYLAALDELRVVDVDVDPSAMHNVNRPDQLRDSR